jgi:hypothetical protein
VSQTGFSAEGEIVVLRMTKRDYITLMDLIIVDMLRDGSASLPRMRELVDLLNRLNVGHPTYPHQELPIREPVQ